MDYLKQELEKLEAKIAETEALVPHLGEVARQEIENLRKQKEEIMSAMEGQSGKAAEGQSEIFNSVILEIRPGVGGEEAKIWAQDLARMYSRYIENSKYKIEKIDDGVYQVYGRNVYDLLKYETGVHRVQRVPETEAGGRIHTSTASVVVLPEVPESAIEIKEDDLVWEFVRGGGHGGQNVNKVATSVRLTHKPSGIVIKSSQERFQEQNRKIALSLLRAQLWEREEEMKRSKIKDQRSKIGRSMRSEKIRTYNYPQNRVTDHRINKSWHKLDRIIEGDLDDVLTLLATHLSQ